MKNRIETLERLILKLKGNSKILPLKIECMEWQLRALKAESLVKESDSLPCVRLSLPTGDELHNTMLGRNVLMAISFPIANKLNTHPEKVTDVVEQIINNLNRQ